MIDAHMQKIDKVGRNAKTGMAHFPESGHLTLLIYSS